MRVANWRAAEVFDAASQQINHNAGVFMDSVLAIAVQRCPPPGKTNIYRPPGWSNANVKFTPRRGKDKGKLIQFNTSKRWTGRDPGDLRGTIRRVDKITPSRTSMRIYAGNFKLYWAFMVEYGTASTGWGGPAAATPFLRPAWNSRKAAVGKALIDGSTI